jgi:hypothetical protein
MELLHSGSEESASHLVQVFVEMLWCMQCSQQIRRYRAEDRPHQFTAATNVEHVAMPSRKLCRCSIENKLEVAYPQPAKGNWQPKIGDWKRGSQTAEMASTSFRFICEQWIGTTELLATLILRPELS